MINTFINIFIITIFLILLLEVAAGVVVVAVVCLITASARVHRITNHVTPELSLVFNNDILYLYPAVAE